MSGAEIAQKEDMKRKKDNSITEEMEALGDLEAYAESISYSSDMKVDPSIGSKYTISTNPDIYPI
ncbi:MAG: hypothetical protein GEU26_16545 [Nitrososphaeraceae archaeon]|jgi:hypothetical protein|nr:hypothetical protein [Nitrososphaeraceae archaeon]